MTQSSLFNSCELSRRWQSFICHLANFHNCTNYTWVRYLILRLWFKLNNLCKWVWILFFQQKKKNVVETTQNFLNYGFVWSGSVCWSTALGVSLIPSVKCHRIEYLGYYDVCKLCWPWWSRNYNLQHYIRVCNVCKSIRTKLLSPEKHVLIK